MERQAFYYKLIKSLKKNLAQHIVIFFLISAYHYLIYESLYWLNNCIEMIYIISNILILLFGFFPLIPIIFLNERSGTDKLLFYKKISIILSFITLGLGIISNLVLWLNYIKYPKFIRDCPYNLNINSRMDLLKVTEEADGKLTNYYCISKICIQSKNDNLKYLCNYNSHDDYIKSKEKVTCNEIIEEFNMIKEFDSNVIDNYYSTCNSYTFFYLCTREKKVNDYNITYDYYCPENRNMILLYIIGSFSIILDLFGLSFIWTTDVFNIKRIIYILSNENINGENRRTACSLNSTANSSKIENSNNNIQNNNQDSFIRNQTEVIIVSHEKKSENENFDDFKTNISINDLTKSNNILLFNEINNSSPTNKIKEANIKAQMKYNSKSERMNRTKNIDNNLNYDKDLDKNINQTLNDKTNFEDI